MNFIKPYLRCCFFKILALKTKQLRLHMYIYGEVVITCVML